MDRKDAEDFISESENANLNEQDDSTLGDYAQQKFVDPDYARKGAENAYSATISTPNATQYAINDSPSTTDSIGFAPFVTALSRLISHPETKTPLTVGLYGPWGSGKSSFMEQVKIDIKKNSDSIQQVDFNAWKHDASHNLWLVLLQTLFVKLEEPLGFFEKYLYRLRGLIRNANKVKAISSIVLITVILFYFVGELGPEIIKAAKNQENTEPVLTVLINSSPGWISSLLILGFLSPSVFGLMVKMLKPIGVNLSGLISGRNFRESIETIEGFRGCFSSLIKLYLGENGRLVIYIDDLDRCSPDNAVEVIETINILLGIEQTIFVLGIDRDKLTLSVEAKYKDLIELDYKQQQWSGHKKSLINDGRRFGEHFMEKMIQLPISVPHPGIEEIRVFARGLVDENIKPDKRDDKNDKDEINNVSTNEKIELVDPVKDGLINVIEHLGRNPRSIKRFYNAYRFVHFLYILNAEKFSGLNELALPYWYFIYHQFGSEITAAYRDKVLNRPDEDKIPLSQFFKDVEEQCPEMKIFLTKVDAFHSDWAIVYNSGRPVSSYYKLTRAIFY